MTGASPLLPLRPRWRGLGLPAVAGLAALAAAALLALGLTPHWQAGAAALQSQQRAERLAARPALADARTTPRPWPAADTREMRLAALIDSAAQHGVTITGASQQVRQEAAAGVAWHVLSTPARGSYAGLRAFIADALQADEALALESLRLRRDGADSATLDAELTWAFGHAAEAPARP